MFLRDNQTVIEILWKKIDIQFEQEGFYACKTNCKQIYQAMKKGAKEGYILSEYRKVIGTWNLSNNKLIEWRYSTCTHDYDEIELIGETDIK